MDSGVTPNSQHPWRVAGHTRTSGWAGGSGGRAGLPTPLTGAGRGRGGCAGDRRAGVWLGGRAQGPGLEHRASKIRARVWVTMEWAVPSEYAGQPTRSLPPLCWPP